MALDYEIRSEFKDTPLEQLLDHSVASFQGVGDTAQSLLNTYFGIITIGQLANMPHFVQALAVQKMALESEKVANTPVSSLMATRALKFSVREDERHLTVKQLLDAPMHSLEGLAPAEDLALYDAFRVTSLRQLAHNRIMIEARIIQYLARHGAEAANMSGSADDVVALLAGDLPPGNGKPRTDAEQPATPDEAEGELAEHVRGRLDALRGRAKQRVHDMSPRESAGTDDRMSAIRATRDRAAAERAGRGDAVGFRTGGRGDAVAAARSGATSAVLAARENRVASRAKEVTSNAAARESVRRSVTATTRSGPAAGAARPSSPAAGTRPSTRELKEQAKREEEAAAAAKAADLAEKKSARRAPPPPTIQPWMIAAAAVLVVALAAVVWFMRSGQEPPVQPAESSVEAPSVAGGAQTAPATAAGAPVQMAGATNSSTASTITGPPLRDVRYTVRRGNSLWRISRMHYSDPLLWPDIFTANRADIDDPDLIYPGQRFYIPNK